MLNKVYEPEGTAKQEWHNKYKALWPLSNCEMVIAKKKKKCLSVTL